MNHKLIMASILFSGACQAMNQPDEAGARLEELARVAQAYHFDIDQPHLLAAGTHRQLGIRNAAFAIPHVEYDRLFVAAGQERIDSLLFFQVNLTGGLPISLAHFERLNSIIISNCQLADNDLAIIIDRLPQNIRILVVNGTQITRLPDLGRFLQLDTLDIVRNQIGGHAFARVMDTLPQAIIRLDASGNPLGAGLRDGAVLERVVGDFARFGQLQNLGLASTGINAQDLDFFLAGIPATLLDLNLSGNPHFGFPAEGVLGRFIRLHLLNLDNNGITDNDLAALINELPLTIAHLSLNDNPIHIIPLNIGRLVSLRTMNLDGSLVTQAALTAVGNVLPASLMRLSIRRNGLVAGMRLGRPGMLMVDRPIIR